MDEDSGRGESSPKTNSRGALLSTIREQLTFNASARARKCRVRFPATNEELDVDSRCVDRCRADPILYRMLRPEFVRNRGRKLFEESDVMDMPPSPILLSWLSSMQDSSQQPPPPFSSIIRRESSSPGYNSPPAATSGYESLSTVRAASPFGTSPSGGTALGDVNAAGYSSFEGGRSLAGALETPKTEATDMEVSGYSSLEGARQLHFSPDVTSSSPGGKRGIPTRRLYHQQSSGDSSMNEVTTLSALHGYSSFEASAAGKTADSFKAETATTSFTSATSSDVGSNLATESLKEHALRAPPLSPDVFMACTQDTTDGWDRQVDVVMASRVLFESVIPRLAKTLIKEYKDDYSKQKSGKGKLRPQGEAGTPTRAREDVKADDEEKGVTASDTASQQGTSAMSLSPPELRRCSSLRDNAMMRSDSAQESGRGPATPVLYSSHSSTGGNRTYQDMVANEEFLGSIIAGSGEQLCDTMHLHGVNIRHMGLLRAHCLCEVNDESNGDDVTRQAVDYLGHLMLIEMVCRELKNALKDFQRRWMRKNQSASRYGIHSLVARFLNHVTGAVPIQNCQAFWEDLSDRILDHFGSAALTAKERGYDLFQLCVTPGTASDRSCLARAGQPLDRFEHAHRGDIDAGSHVQLIIMRLLHMSGIGITGEAAHGLKIAPYGGAGFEFVAPDILEIRPVIKKMHRMNVIEGHLLHLEAIHRETLERSLSAEIDGDRRKGHAWLANERDADTSLTTDRTFLKAAAIEIKTRYGDQTAAVGDRATQRRLDALASLSIENAMSRIPDDVTTRHLLADTFQSRAYALRNEETVYAAQERRRLFRRFQELRQDDRNTRCYLTKRSYTEDILGVVLAVKCSLKTSGRGRWFPRMLVFAQPLSFSAYLRGAKQGFREMLEEASAEDSVEAEWMGTKIIEGEFSFPGNSLAEFVEEQKAEKKEPGEAIQPLTLQFLPIVVDQEHGQRAKSLLRYCVDAVLSFCLEPYVDLTNVSEDPDPIPIGGDVFDIPFRSVFESSTTPDQKRLTLFANSRVEEIEVHAMEVVGQLMNSVVVSLASRREGNFQAQQNTLEMYCRLHHFLLSYITTSRYMARRIDRYVELFRIDPEVRKNGKKKKSRVQNSTAVGPSLNKFDMDPHCTPDLGVFLVYLLISSHSWDSPKNRKLREGFVHESMLRKCYWQIASSRKDRPASAPHLLHLERPRQSRNPMVDLESVGAIKTRLRVIRSEAKSKLEQLEGSLRAFSASASPTRQHGDFAVESLLHVGDLAIDSVKTCLTAASITEYELLRIRSCFDSSKTSHRTLMYQVLFMKAMRESNNAALLSLYNRSFGRPTPSMRQQLQNAPAVVNAVDGYDKYFRVMDVWYGPKRLCALLRDALRLAIHDQQNGMNSDGRLHHQLRQMGCDKVLECKAGDAPSHSRSPLAQRAYQLADKGHRDAVAREIERWEWSLVNLAIRLVELLDEASAKLQMGAQGYDGLEAFQGRVREISRLSEVERILQEAETKVKRLMSQKNRSPTRSQQAGAKEARSKSKAPPRTANAKAVSTELSFVEAAKASHADSSATPSSPAPLQAEEKEEIPRSPASSGRPPRSRKWPWPRFRSMKSPKHEA
uniref:CLU central domain-containing protein n=1 Tax=Pinguiococcus pyrenoidosus TaxID=172671 RepID=A0A7R9UEN8_9STRA